MSNTNAVEAKHNEILEAMGYDSTVFMVKPGTIPKPWGSQGKPQYSLEVVPRFPPTMGDDLKRAFKDLTKDLGKYVVDYDPDSSGLGMLAMSDLHAGKRTPGGVKAQVRDAMDLGVTLIDDMLTKWDLERLVILYNGDTLDFDNFKATTTGQTALEDTGCDFPTMFSYMKTGTIGLINWAAQYVPVDVLIVEGNHDGNAAFALAQVLDTAYGEDVPNVNVVSSGADSFYYYRYACNLLTFHHGHSVQDGKQLEALASTDARKDWGETTHQYFFTGHIHKRFKIQNHYGLMALVDRNGYAKRAGYAGTLQGAEGHVFDKELGRIGGVERSWT